MILYNKYSQIGWGNVIMDTNNPLQKVSYIEKIIELSTYLKMSGNSELIEHSSEVAQLARMILKNLKKSPVKIDDKTKNIMKYMDIDTLADVYELHDLGKIFIPDEILNKPGRLNEQEFHYVYKHPENVKKVLDHHEFNENSKAMQLLYDTTLLISLEHHENFDGSGYPRHLKGEEISILGRIARVADVISALMGHRCYNREFNSFESITNYLVKNKGALFDPHIVDIVVNNIENEDRLSITKKRILDVFDIRNEINKITKRINAKSR